MRRPTSVRQENPECRDYSGIGHASPSLAEHVRFHDLRHPCATLLLGQGVHPKVVSEMLGHCSAMITLDTYWNVLPSMQEDAAQPGSDLVGERRRRIADAP